MLVADSISGPDGAVSVDNPEELAENVADAIGAEAAPKIAISGFVDLPQPGLDQPRFRFPRYDVTPTSGPHCRSLRPVQTRATTTPDFPMRTGHPPNNSNSPSPNIRRHRPVRLGSLRDDGDRRGPRGAGQYGQSSYQAIL